MECLCGCGKEVTQKKRGRSKKYASSAHAQRVRYRRQKGKSIPYDSDMELMPFSEIAKEMNLSPQRILQLYTTGMKRYNENVAEFGRLKKQYMSRG